MHILFNEVADSMSEEFTVSGFMNCVPDSNKKRNNKLIQACFPVIEKLVKN